MKSAEEHLGKHVNYQAIAEIQAHALPKVMKEEIPRFIVCAKYDKGMQNVARIMERYVEKIAQMEERLSQAKADIEGLKDEQRKWAGKASTFLLDRTDARAVEKQNHAAENANRLLAKIEAAIDNYNQMVEARDELAREAREKEGELSREALSAIDEDILVALDKCLQVGDRMVGSDNVNDIAVGIEACFTTLKIYSAFEEHIEGSVHRRAAKEAAGNAQRVCAKICSQEVTGSYLSDVFRRNVELIEKNAELAREATTILGSVNREHYCGAVDGLRSMLAYPCKSDFQYEGIIDPVELEAVVKSIQEEIVNIQKAIVQLNDMREQSGELAGKAMEAHQGAKDHLAAMRGNVQQAESDLVFRGHYLCDLLDRDILEEFFTGETRPSILALQKQVESAVGPENLEAISSPNGDRYSLTVTDSAIESAGLNRLEKQRQESVGKVEKFGEVIRHLESCIHEAEEVPRKNADVFRSAMNSLSLLSCIPVIGLIFALNLQSKANRYAPGFRSSNQVYRNLVGEVLAKTRTFSTVNLLMGLVVALVGIALLLSGIRLTGSSQGHLIGTGVILGCYLLTALILFMISSKVRSLSPETASAL